jgi:hypothetical protein
MSEILPFNEALDRTINRKTNKGLFGMATFGSSFQIFSYFIFLFSCLSIYPLVGGMAYLEKVPPKYQCYESQTP